jgi:hypothetical protein
MYSGLKRTYVEVASPHELCERGYGDIDGYPNPEHRNEHILTNKLHGEQTAIKKKG